MAMNKEITKIMLSHSGIPVPEGIVLEKGGEIENVGFPCVVKPCSGGSSVGTSWSQARMSMRRRLSLHSNMKTAFLSSAL